MASAVNDSLSDSRLAEVPPNRLVRLIRATHPENDGRVQMRAKGRVRDGDPGQHVTNPGRYGLARPFHIVIKPSVPTVETLCGGQLARQRLELQTGRL